MHPLVEAYDLFIIISSSLMSLCLEMAYIILSMAFAGFILGFAYGRHVGNQSTLSEEDLEFLHTIEERIMQRGDGLFGDVPEEF